MKNFFSSVVRAKGLVFHLLPSAPLFVPVLQGSSYSSSPPTFLLCGQRASYLNAFLSYLCCKGKEPPIRMCLIICPCVRKARNLIKSEYFLELSAATLEEFNWGSEQTSCTPTCC